MDDRDITILKAIADLGTGSPEALQEETGIPVSTIHYRLNNLRDDGVITNDLYDINPDSIGLDVTVVLEVLTSYDGGYEDVADEISAVEGVTQTFFTMGETDFVVVARLPGSDDVERLISDFEALDPVDRTNSTFVIDRHKDAQRALESYSLDSLVTALADE
ncbi:Lrp/AsnC family transcriptional regulator [Halobacterium salinarum]|uniref:Transcription regulator n=4 Tax=Halobacterium salinarum TaxID=2242 RepID=Q9HQ33_HALSA|nr:Lrp/AsnC family transcriptional regulator [Halobacterium salinarum]AAG19684.1 transcription regulator [Halobacterium salinarum NRC-1]MBB6088686.1 DNA-binding Lrp family transcriptional regulator [Halobacterium salinarum]MDL0118906.1 Lrp/AsnC family transcriptional regulator [Halobacterium salinarum]MDL0130018.1 Lrp/AsnC family transcriptional regulator [Halobacterium salinarum]MDL0142965.1 Lrp/AsnC family transcriptional regulator [Halobacterium salinarum]